MKKSIFASAMAFAANFAPTLAGHIDATMTKKTPSSEEPLVHRLQAIQSLVEEDGDEKNI